MDFHFPVHLGHWPACLSNQLLPEFHLGSCNRSYSASIMCNRLLRYIARDGLRFLASYKGSCLNAHHTYPISPVLLPCQSDFCWYHKNYLWQPSMGQKARATSLAAKTYQSNRPRTGSSRWDCRWGWSCIGTELAWVPHLHGQEEEHRVLVRSHHLPCLLTHCYRLSCLQSVYHKPCKSLSMILNWF